VGVAKPVGYQWQECWNESCYDGLIPLYAGGRASKLSDEQKERLQSLLKEKDGWTAEKSKY
jgi:putative transposase